MKIKFLIAIAMLMLVFIGCQKDNELPIENSSPTDSINDALITEALANLSFEEKKFFDPNYLTSTIQSESPQAQVIRRTDLDAIVNQVFNNILLQNAEKNFVEDLILNFGYPAWDQIVLKTAKGDNSIHIANIPFADIGATSINANLIATISSQGDIEFALIERNALDGIIANGDHSFDISYHVAMFVTLDDNLFNNPSQGYLDWLTAFNKNDLQNDQVQVRCYSIEIEECHPCVDIALQGNEVETRCENCYIVEMYTFGCGGGGGSSGSGIGGFGSGTTTTTTEIGETNQNGGGGSGNTNSNPTPFEDLLTLCGGVESGPSIFENPIDGCNELNIIIQATGWQANDSRIEWLFGSDYWGEVISYLEENIPLTPYDKDMVRTFMDMSNEGEIDIEWEEFKVLFNTVVGQLQPTLDLDLNYVNFLLQNEDIADNFISAINQIGGIANVGEREKELLNMVLQFNKDYSDLEDIDLYKLIKPETEISIPTIDYATATDQKKINRFLYGFKVASAAFKYNGVYKDVNWQEYFTNIGAGAGGQSDQIEGKAILKNGVEFDIIIVYNLDTKTQSIHSGTIDSYLAADGLYWSKFKIPQNSSNFPIYSIQMNVLSVNEAKLNHYLWGN